MTSPIIDRLRIFVSSTIKECAEERVVARDAIHSINHEPILFEDIGARPHTPRKLYVARLGMSHVFVGIYRESYGWIAPDMNISGVEDEFRIAEARGLDRLIYVYKNPTAREPKLEALIDVAKNAGLTVAMYSSPAQLGRLIRDDLTAVISERFVDQALGSREAPQANEVLDSLIPNKANRFRRPEIEAKIIHALLENRRLLITAPLGGGKTVLLAQLAAENDWIFVDGQGLSRLDLLARAANSVRKHLGQHSVTLVTEQGATQELLRGLKALKDATLAVDNAGEPMVLWELADKNFRLILTSRSRLEIPSKQQVELPPLNQHEINTWVTAMRLARPDPGALSKLASDSGGNPLYLRFYALGEATSAALSLPELEIRAVQSLPPRAKEITSYLALSSRPLSLGDLQTLTASREGPEEVAEQIAIASGLISQTRNNVRLVHEHLRETLLGQLRLVPTRLAFFASRLGRYFEESEHYVAAFHAYVEANEKYHVDRILKRAANQAALFGGGAPAIPIFSRQVELARESGKSDEEVQALLSLAYALNQTGARADSISTLRNAKSLAERQKIPEQLLIVREMEIVLDLAGTPRTERIRDLIALQESYSEKGDAFNAARIMIQLATEYMSGHEYTNAESASREALKVFTRLGDEYGARIARVDLAAALSTMSGREREVAAIAQMLQQELDPDIYPRERAVLCNLLTHHYRELGNTALASEFALEAIQIGEHLGDKHLIAINRMNLGNVRRDEGGLDQALGEYRTAELIAIDASIREIEAAANELIASVHNERGEYRLALQFAQHASSLARLIDDPVLIARAEEECAIAFKGERDDARAIRSYTEAAKAIVSFRMKDSFFASVLGDALNLCVASRRSDLKIQLLQEVFVPDLRPTEGTDKIRPLEVLYAALPEMAKTIRTDRLVALVVLSMSDLLSDIPKIVERRIILQAIHSLTRAQSDLEPNSVLAAVAAILMAHSGNSLSLGDLVDVAEQLTWLPGSRVYFKPEADGAAHWTVSLEIAGGVSVTLLQLDDSPKTSVVTTILALLLKSLEVIIGQRLLEAERLPRQEAIINVASRIELEAQLGSEILKLGDMPNHFAVAQSTDFSRSDQPPILVVCSDDFATSWRPHEHAFSDTHFVFGEILRTLVGHLLAQAVEPEVLFPKISRLVRKISYGGALDRTH